MGGRPSGRTVNREMRTSGWHGGFLHGPAQRVGRAPVRQAHGPWLRARSAVGNNLTARGAHGPPFRAGSLPCKNPPCESSLCTHPKSRPTAATMSTSPGTTLALALRCIKPAGLKCRRELRLFIVSASMDLGFGMAIVVRGMKNYVGGKPAMSTQVRR